MGVQAIRHWGISAGLFAALCSASWAWPGLANDVSLAETEVFAISRGGQIYDNWMSALEADAPEGPHPAYPSEGEKTGTATWRCKECHGWDYLGKHGAYGQGSHYTGITGIRRLVGQDPQTVKAIVRDDTHRYTRDMLSDRALDKLALFVTRGQIDMNQHIDRRTTKAHGNAARGARFFQTICAKCHGLDGREISFEDEHTVEFVGTVAQDNPWEVLHKIRHGQPGTPMISAIALTIENQLDILAYAQTLPVD